MLILWNYNVFVWLIDLILFFFYIYIRNLNKVLKVSLNENVECRWFYRWLI